MALLNKLAHLLLFLLVFIVVSGLVNFLDAREDSDEDIDDKDNVYQSNKVIKTFLFKRYVVKRVNNWVNYESDQVEYANYNIVAYLVTIHRVNYAMSYHFFEIDGTLIFLKNDCFSIMAHLVATLLQHYEHDSESFPVGYGSLTNFNVSVELSLKALHPVDKESVVIWAVFIYFGPTASFCFLDRLLYLLDPSIKAALLIKDHSRIMLQFELLFFELANRFLPERLDHLHRLLSFVAWYSLWILHVESKSIGLNLRLNSFQHFLLLWILKKIIIVKVKRRVCV